MASTVPAGDGSQVNRFRSRFRSFFGRNSGSNSGSDPAEDMQDDRGDLPTKWSMGVLNDKLTHEVPGEYREYPLYLQLS